MNLTQVKLDNNTNSLLQRPLVTSNPFKSDADTDYDNKKKAEKQAIHQEIKRVSNQNRYYLY